MMLFVEKINIPHKFRMRLESRHCVESRIIYFRFRVLDKACLQCNVFLKGLSEEMKEALSDERIDFAVIYEGIQGSQQDTDTDDKDGFLRFSTASSVLGGRGLSRPLIKPPSVSNRGVRLQIDNRQKIIGNIRLLAWFSSKKSAVKSSEKIFTFYRLGAMVLNEEQGIK